jgi:RNA polymerase sigma-70 factor (ECF subfamily)
MSGEADFETAVRDYTPRLLALARLMLGEAHEAEDVVQDAFAKAWQRWDDADLRAHALPWLLTVVKNRCIDLGRVRAPDVGFERLPEKPAPPAAEEPIRTATLDQVIEAVRRLPEPYRTVLLLRFSQKLPYEEIAAVTSVPLEQGREAASGGARMTTPCGRPTARGLSIGPRPTAYGPRNSNPAGTSRHAVS